MFDVVTELVKFCEEHGVPPWVRDEFNRVRRLDQWAAEFIGRYADDIAAEARADAARLHAVVALLDENPRQKTISIARLRTAMADG